MVTDLLPLEYLADPSRRLYWLYLVSSVAIAAVYFMFHKRALRVNMSKKLWLHPSALLDYRYFFVAFVIKVAVIVPVVISAKEVARLSYMFLTERFGYVQIDSLSYMQVVALYTAVLFIVSDFTRYWLHRWLHASKFLWRFHKVHHSAKVLNPLTFYRVHPVENLLFGLRYALSIGTVTGVFIYLFGALLDIYDVLGVNIAVFLFALMGSNLRHSHVPLGYGRVLEQWFISPRQHQLHHTRSYMNKNYGGYLAVWDRVFGTLQLAKESKASKFGLLNEQMPGYDSIVSLLIRPIIGEKHENRTTAK